jgi:hypothetical protein
MYKFQERLLREVEQAEEDRKNHVMCRLSGRATIGTFDVYVPDLGHPSMVERIFTVQAYSAEEAGELVSFCMENGIMLPFRQEAVPNLVHCDKPFSKSHPYQLSRPWKQQPSKVLPAALAVEASRT